MEFMPGLQLSERLYTKAIAPMLAKAFPELIYSAARLEWGSDVLGFDTPMSMDHGWGPKMTLFLNEEDAQVYQGELSEYFANHLPFQIDGFPTHFAEPLEDGGVMAQKESYPIRHQISITTPEQFFESYLGIDIHQRLTPETWLTIPQQRLRTLRSGRIYYDGLGCLEEMRERLHWYPHDLWLYLMANQWQRIDQEEPFVGRTGSLGDEMGSKLIAARLIKDLVRLGFLMEKQYAPYSKWFGRAYQELKIAPQTSPLFDAILASQDWEARQSHLSQAYLLMAEAHNALNVTPLLNPQVSYFHDRPFLVPHSARFVEALLNEILDPAVKSLPPRLGSIDQIVDNTEVLDTIPRCQKLKTLYAE
jgi:hypothetical protein